jgi:hypothetical protein
MPSLPNFCHIFGCGSVEGCQEHCSSVTDIHPFLKRLNHLQVCVWHRALSPNASSSMLCVLGAILLSLKQNLLQIHCTFTSVIWCNCQTALTHHHKNAQKKRTHSHSGTLLGRVLHKGHSL